MVGRRFLPWIIAPLAAIASPSVAQFVPRDVMIPVEQAARTLPPDRTAPTLADLDRIGVLEKQVRIDTACNSTSEAALESPRRALLQLYEDSYGPGHPATARPLLSLLCHFAYNGKTAEGRAERERIIDRLIAIGRDRNQPLTLYAGLSAHAELRREQNRMQDALVSDREALALARRHLADRPERIATSARSLAASLAATSGPSAAEPLLQEAVTLLQGAPGIDPFTLADAYRSLGENLTAQLRVADAKPWFSRALDIIEAALPGADRNGLDHINLYSQTMFWIDPPRIDALYRAVLARQEALPGSSDARNWMTLWNLAKSSSLMLDQPSAVFRTDLTEAIGYQRRVVATAVGPAKARMTLDLANLLAQRRETAPEAERIYRDALTADPENPKLVEQLGNLLWLLERYDDALPLRRRTIAEAAARLGPDHRETIRLNQNLGMALWIARRPLDARPYLEDVLAGYRAEQSALPETANAAYRANLGGFISTKAIELLKLYWIDRQNPGQGGEADLRTRGFAMAQFAHPSASGAAISETAARALAERAGKSAAFLRWTAARDRVVTLDEAIGQAAQRGAAGDADRVRLLGERAAAGDALGVAAADLRTELPALFATLRPEPVALTEVMGAKGTPALLRKDEALVLLFPGISNARGEMSRGIIFAATREGSAWAEIPIDGADLASAAADLHGQLSDATYSGATRRNADQELWQFLRYDRSAAHRVYQGLFGDPAIAALLGGKKRWILVPEGPLLSLNFAALVTAPPEGGDMGDIDPAMLRKTAWLGLDRVLTVLPTVDALRTARRTPARAWAGGKFYGVGDPAFTGKADPPPNPTTAGSRGQTLAVPNGGTPAITGRAGMIARQGLYRDGVADPTRLAGLRRLDHSASEVLRMAQYFGAPAERRLLQLDATQARIDRSNADGTLADSQIILFATHALLGGRFDGTLAEPALALTPGARPPGIAATAADDGLLTASEVAQLRLDAALVILSACDTAAGSDGGDGFSGLTRAFLLAGARAILATYSPVLDDVGERMTTSTVTRLKDERGDIAAALQSTMRDLLFDPSKDERGASLAHPAAWAVYVAIDPS